jgi:hypothetical protein
MNSLIYSLAFIICVGIDVGNSYPSGAPPDICGSMMPKHTGGAVLPCQGQYIIEADKLTYGTNDSIRGK